MGDAGNCAITSASSRGFNARYPPNRSTNQSPLHPPSNKISTHRSLRRRTIVMARLLGAKSVHGVGGGGFLRRNHRGCEGSCRERDHGKNQNHGIVRLDRVELGGNEPSGADGCRNPGHQSGSDLRECSAQNHGENCAAVPRFGHQVHAELRNRLHETREL